MENNKKVLFSVRNLKKYFPLKKKFLSKERNYVHANESVSIDIYEGETLGLVGESGCGKSTLGRTLIQIYEQTEGTTLYYGTTIFQVAPKYVEHDLKTLAKLYPKYLEAKTEIEKMYHEEQLLVSELENLSGDKYKDTELKLHALQDKLMYKRRDIENNYYNMLRLAGALLLDNNLQEVSNLLLNRYKAGVELAKIDKLIVEATKGEEAEFGIDLDVQEKPVPEDLKNKRELALQKLDEAEKIVEERRQLLKNHDNFEQYESYRDEGIDLARLNKHEMRELRKEMQIIFQDPYSSLDTRMTVGNIIGEGVLAHKVFKNSKSEFYNKYIEKVMKECGLAPYFIHRYPHQFSGGQRQRIGIARALAMQPKFIVCDEAVSALDVSIQSQIINLLQDLKREKGLTYLFITHDLSVVKYISDRIAVMYLGMMVELTDSDELFTNAQHPYTTALLDAIPRTDVDSNHQLGILEGDIPSAVKPPKGCRFHTRCRYCMQRCETYEPQLQEIKPGHFVACHLLDMKSEDKEAWMKECDTKVLQEEHEKEEQMKKVAHQLEIDSEN